MDREAVWMIGTFVELVWVEQFQKKRKVKIDHLIGFLDLLETLVDYIHLHFNL